MALHQLAVAGAVLLVCAEETHFDPFKELLFGQTGDAEGCLGLVGGCMVGSDYVRPDTSAQLPADFKVPVGWKVAEPSDREVRGAWWRRFGDA